MEKCTTSEEEANFLRIFKLVTGVGTDVVRCKFDQLFPPPSLASNLQNHKQKLTQLNIERRLNMKQMTLLFPATGTPSSRNFDMTLMICLIRNLTCISPPINGFDKQPPGSETTIGADMARIKITRNRLAHADSNKISSSDFNVIWSDLTGACVRLGGQQYKRICDDIKSLELINGTQLTDFAGQLSGLREEFLEEITDLREIEIKGLQRQVQELFDGQNEILPQYKRGPTSVSVNAITSSSITVKWQPPKTDDIVVTGYSVFWQEKGTDSESRVDLNEEGRNCSIQNLRVWTEYDIRVSSTVRYLADIQTFSSEKISIRTLEGAPTKVPQDVRCIPIEKNSIEVSWKPPPEDGCNGIIKGHKVYVRKDSDSDSYIQTKEVTGSTSILLQGLDSVARYQIWIRAFTKVGTGPNCTQLNFGFKDFVPSSVSVKATGTTTIEVKWDHPISLDKNVTGYRVFWRNESNNDCTKTHEDVEKDKTEHVLKNLSEWTKYSVWISAFTSTQILPSCEKTVVRTHEGVPSKAPQNVKCTPSMHTNSIEITWTAPPARSVNGEIAGYKVYYHKVSDETDENATRIEELGHTANRALLESLESSTTYKIWICVFTQTGCGPSCEPQVVKSCAVPPISNNSSNPHVFVSSSTFSLFNNIQQLNFSGNVNVSMVSETAMQNNMTDHSTTSSLPSSEPGQLPLNQGRSCGALQSSDPKSSPLSQENTCGTEEDINHCHSMAKKRKSEDSIC